MKDEIFIQKISNELLRHNKVIHPFYLYHFLGCDILERKFGEKWSNETHERLQ